MKIATWGTRNRRRTQRVTLAALSMLLGSVALTACSDSGAKSDKKASDELTLAVNAGPVSLDPALNNNIVQSQWFIDLAYEPLIKLAPNGDLAPGLATKWEYVGDKQDQFQLTLREDAKFSDGTSVTAEQVVASLEHEKKMNGPVAVYVNSIKKAEAKDSKTVLLTLDKPNPLIGFYLTERFLIGQIVGKKGTDTPDSLGTTTNGAGQYMIDPKQTVANDKYTYVPNPHYFDKSAVKFKKVTVRVIANPQTVLNSLESGQVDLASGSIPLADAAESAGLTVTSTPAKWVGAFLLDRDGKVAPQLGDERVRQALNFATDRKGITKGVFGKLGVADSQPLVDGYENQGYVADYADHYSYDPARAKKLLAEAGYPDGFELKLATTNVVGYDKEIAQALANDWAKVGVKVNIDGPYTDIPAFIEKWQNRKFPALVCDYGGQPMYQFAQQTLGKDSGLYNPFETEDAELAKLIDSAYAATDSASQKTAWEAVTRRVVDLAWFVPVARIGEVYFSVDGLKGLDISPVAFALNPTAVEF